MRNIGVEKGKVHLSGRRRGGGERGRRNFGDYLRGECELVNVSQRSTCTYSHAHAPAVGRMLLAISSIFHHIRPYIP